MTLDYFVGCGYGFDTYNVNGNSQPYNDDRINHYSHWGFGEQFPLSFTTGLTIGGIF
ncbi:MAG: hypothetical protein HY738_13305 [Bacteroidia bacterium]|nr:hypothetical protein [Bacteroidia bacterium]